jgi:hypothetical protein
MKSYAIKQGYVAPKGMSSARAAENIITDNQRYK